MPRRSKRQVCDPRLASRVVFSLSEIWPDPDLMYSGRHGAGRCRSERRGACMHVAIHPYDRLVNVQLAAPFSSSHPSFFPY